MRMLLQPLYLLILSSISYAVIFRKKIFCFSEAHFRRKVLLNNEFLNRLSVLFTRISTGFIPLKYLDDSMKMSRVFLEKEFDSRLKTPMLTISDNIRKFDFRKLNFLESANESTDKSFGEHIIIFLHGGGFTLCDSVDILIYERLLPLISIRNNIKTSKLFFSAYSILYDTSCHSFTYDDESKHYLRLQEQIFDSYQTIISLHNHSNNNVKITIIGDSAGGNLAINLARQIMKTDTNIDANDLQLCLLSPWLDLFSEAPSYIENKYHDFINIHWGEKSRTAYLNQNFENSIKKKMKEFQKSKNVDFLIKEIIYAGVKVVVFDMDNCMVAKHSMGRLRRKDISKYLSCVTEDFIIAAKALHKNRIQLAVATHSDEYEYIKHNRPSSEYIIGKELVIKVLEYSVPELLPYFKIVTYNPSSHGDNNRNNANKLLHMREISTFYNTPLSQCLLFDDDYWNVRNNRQEEGVFQGYQVNAKIGFQLQTAVVTIRQAKKKMTRTNTTTSCNKVNATLSSVIPLSSENDNSCINDQSKTIQVDNSILLLLHKEARNVNTNTNTKANPSTFTTSDVNDTTPNTLQLQASLPSSSTTTAIASLTNNINCHKINVHHILPPLHYSAVDHFLEDQQPFIVTHHLPVINPIMLNLEQLSQLPNVMIVAGSKEIFIDDILLFADRIIHCHSRSQHTNSITAPSPPTSLTTTKATNDIVEEVGAGQLIESTDDVTDKHTSDTLTSTNSNMKDISFSSTSSTACEPTNTDINSITKELPKRKKSPEIVIGINKLHVFPMFWRFIAHRVSSMIIGFDVVNRFFSFPAYIPFPNLFLFSTGTSPSSSTSSTSTTSATGTITSGTATTTDDKNMIIDTSSSNNNNNNGYDNQDKAPLSPFSINDDDYDIHDDVADEAIFEIANFILR